jgi:hypothetical protein
VASAWLCSARLSQGGICVLPHRQSLLQKLSSARLQGPQKADSGPTFWLLPWAFRTWGPQTISFLMKPPGLPTTQGQVHTLPWPAKFQPHTFSGMPFISHSLSRLVNWHSSEMHWASLAPLHGMFQIWLAASGLSPMTTPRWTMVCCLLGTQHLLPPTRQPTVA